MQKSNRMCCSINLDEELERYHLDGKWNDYIGVQKNVLSRLRDEGFFENNRVMNKDSGMIVAITAKGIKETLSKGKRFQNLPKVLKQLKVATIRRIPRLIEEGIVISDDVSNLHGKNNMYAYILALVEIDRKIYGVRISICKKIQGNIFWIHHIDYMKKDFGLFDSSPGKEFKERQNP